MNKVYNVLGAAVLAGSAAMVPLNDADAFFGGGPGWGGWGGPWGGGPWGYGGGPWGYGGGPWGYGGPWGGYGYGGHPPVMVPAAPAATKAE